MNRGHNPPRELRGSQLHPLKHRNQCVEGKQYTDDVDDFIHMQTCKRDFLSSQCKFDHFQPFSTMH